MDRRFCVVATQGATRLLLQLGERTLEAAVPNTGDYAVFQDVALGRIQVDQPGSLSLAVRTDKQAWSPVNIQTITLEPVP